MTNFRFLAIAAIAAAGVMTSCSNDDEAVNNSNDRVAVAFSAGGASAVQTRVNGASWDSGDPIGIYMVDDGTTDVTDGFANVSYNASASGTGAIGFTAASTVIYYPQNGDAVDFIAYHPYLSSLSASDWIYPVNVSSQSSQTAIDLMWAGIVDNGGAGFDKTNTAAVNLPFTHKLAKLNLTVVKGAGVTDLSGMTVKIEGMNSSAGFDVKAGILSGLSALTTITPLCTQTPSVSASGKYEAILLPVTLGVSHEITFTIGSETYTWRLFGTGGITGGVLAPATKYSYTVTVQKAGTLFVTGTITDWTAVTGTGIAE